MVFLKKSSLKQWRPRFFNSKGTSIPELMVSMGISMIVSLIATLAFSMAFDVYLRMIRQYDAEVEMSSLMYTLRSTMTAGVHVEYGGRASVANNAFTNNGQPDERAGVGRIFSITDVDVPAGGTTYAGEPILVGMFNREMAAFSATQSNLQAVQIVYQRPSGNFSGAIYVDPEFNTTAGGGWVRARPINAPLMFTRITNFQIDNLKVYDTSGAMVNVTSAAGGVCVAAPGDCTARPISSAEVQVVMRYFTSGDESSWRWCNLARAGLFVATCDMVNVTYHDVERKMTVVFGNNAYQRSEYLPRRPFGNVYFFNPWRPLRKL